MHLIKYEQQKCSSFLQVIFSHSAVFSSKTILPSWHLYRLDDDQVGDDMESDGDEAAFGERVQTQHPTCHSQCPVGWSAALIGAKSL
jgi:hypothetical protein